MDGERRRARRAAWTAAVAAALPVLLLANQALDGWRQRAFLGFLGPSSGIGQQAVSLLAQSTAYFAWRWSPTDTIGQLGVASLSLSIGSGALAAQDLSDLAFILLTWLFVAGVARSWRPRPGRVAQGAAVWGAALLAASLSGLIVPEFFGAPGAGGGMLVFMTNGMADRAPGGIVFGLFAALVVMIAETVVDRRDPVAQAGERETDDASGPASAGGPEGPEGSAQPGSGAEADSAADGGIVLPEPRRGDAQAQPNETGPSVSSDVEFLGDFELGEAGPPGSAP